MEKFTFTDNQAELLLQALNNELKTQEQVIREYAKAVPGQFDCGVGKNDRVMESLLARKREILVLMGEIGGE